MEPLQTDTTVTGRQDPEGEAPWAMQLVARVERAASQSHTAVCEAAATAVVMLLADQRAQVGGAWHPEIERWTSGRIRKHVRKARGAAWDRVHELPGVTVTHDGAQVRAFVPCPVDAVPKDIARLQLQGLELADPESHSLVDPEPGGVLVVSICPDPALPTGKAAAAAGHAAQLAQLVMPAERAASWAALGFPVAVEHPETARWEQLRTDAPVVVVDAGFTIVAPDTTTALARWA